MEEAFYSYIEPRLRFAIRGPMKGPSQRQIGEQLGVSQQTVSRYIAEVKTEHGMSIMFGDPDPLYERASVRRHAKRILRF